MELRLLKDCLNTWTLDIIISYTGYTSLHCIVISYSIISLWIMTVNSKIQHCQIQSEYVVYYKSNSDRMYAWWLATIILIDVLIDYNIAWNRTFTLMTFEKWLRILAVWDVKHIKYCRSKKLWILNKCYLCILAILDSTDQTSYVCKTFKACIYDLSDIFRVLVLSFPDKNICLFHVSLLL